MLWAACAFSDAVKLCAFREDAVLAVLEGLVRAQGQGGDKVGDRDRDGGKGQGQGQGQGQGKGQGRGKGRGQGQARGTAEPVDGSAANSPALVQALDLALAAGAEARTALAQLLQANAALRAALLRGLAAAAGSGSGSGFGSGGATAAHAEVLEVVEALGWGGVQLL